MPLISEMGTLFIRKLIFENFSFFALKSSIFSKKKINQYFEHVIRVYIENNTYTDICKTLVTKSDSLEIPVEKNIIFHTISKE